MLSVCVRDVSQIRAERVAREREEEARAAASQEAAGGPAKRRKRVVGNDDATAGSFTWDREADFDSHRKMTPQAYADFVNKAKGLDTKFSKSVTRNFM